MLSQKKETGSFRKNGSRASESQIYRTGTDPAFLPYRCIRKAYGNQPVGCFFHAHGKTAPEQQISGGNCAPGADHCGNVYTGKVFCQFLCPMGAVFALMPILPGALFRRNREKCPPKCGLCKKRCPAHLDIDGDTGKSGECLCCHACAAACPRKNIHIGTIEEK